jgi:endonuclease/exonuclease/phosphatase family metal-dependent hydrolase
MQPGNFSSRKRKGLLTLVTFGVAVLIFIIQFYTAKNYSYQNYPYYSGNYAIEDPNLVETLTVVSYNIWFAENIDQAVSEIREIASQKGLDILLLQEMDEVGTEKIARELQLNYVYFPAAIEPTYDKNFGNAVLSRWPIIDSQKLILPHKSLSNRMNRIATKAKVRIHDADILVYSIHTESIFTLPKFREDQYTAVLDDIDSEAKLVIVGGDFNSFTEVAVKEVEDAYKQAGFTRVSEGGGYTVVKFGIELTSDHIFAKGFVVKDAGKLEAATASDHLPVWVILTLQ